MTEFRIAGFELETKMLASGADVVVGIDEVGRGALAGPLVVGACALKRERIPEGIDDSKRLSPSFRAALAAEIERSALAWAISEVDSGDIDRIGLMTALRLAARKASRLVLEKLDGLPEDKVHYLVDGTVSLLGARRETPIVKGDRRSASIAAASIIAKVHRDKFMIGLASKYPVYGFENNKGYGTRRHLQALKDHGPSPVHRRSFGPVKATFKSSLFSDKEDLI